MILRLSQPYEQTLLNTLKERVDAAKQILTTDKITKYRAWWVKMRKKSGTVPTKEEADKFAKLYQSFTRRVVEEGYRPYDDNPIKITVQGDGRLGCYDGNHRLCALAAAGVEEIEVVDHWVSETWATLVSKLKGTVYQPHPHPSFNGWTVSRPDTADRYREIALRLLKMDCKTAFEIGPCAGTGVQAMAAAGLGMSWCESSVAYSTLCRSLSALQVSTEEVKSILSAPATDAVMGLAVWHHVATSLDALDDAAEHLAGARVHVVELPTPEAPRWHRGYIEDSEQTTEDLPEWTLNRLQEAGKYTHREILRSEPYGNRTTWIMWR